MFYSKASGGFYRLDIHGEMMPGDVVEITDERHAELMDGQAAGKRITADANGYPVLTEPPPPTLAEAKARKRREIAAAYSAELAAITDDYPEVERLTWDKQEREARAWTADNAAATPLLDGIAAARGLALSELVARVIDKADAWISASGAATGKRQALEDAIAAAEDVPTVEAIKW